jgi:hypothetical protein
VSSAEAKKLYQLQRYCYRGIKNGIGNIAAISEAKKIVPVTTLPLPIINKCSSHKVTVTVPNLFVILCTGDPYYVLHTALLIS